jgi:hypothetical protein
MFKETRDQQILQAAVRYSTALFKFESGQYNLWPTFFYFCENFHQKAHWKLGPVKAMKGKRVEKSAGTVKFLWTIDVQLQAPFCHWITKSHLHCRFVKMEPNPPFPSPTFVFTHIASKLQYVIYTYKISCHFIDCP